MINVELIAAGLPRDKPETTPAPPSSPSCPGVIHCAQSPQLFAQLEHAVGISGDQQQAESENEMKP